MHYPGMRLGPISLVPMALATALMLAGGSAFGEVRISEIMYNPASDESSPNDVEWVELYNTGESPVDLSGWYLKDEDGQTVGLPEQTVLESAEALVLIPGEQTVSDFRGAWDCQAQVFALAGWQGPGGLAGLSNTPSAKNEMLELRAPKSTGADPPAESEDEPDADGAKTPATASEVVDAVNYDDADPWPSDSPDGASIYLTPGHLSAADNDAGEHWARSKRYINHAVRSTITADFNRESVGSPGRVATEPIDATPPPAEEVAPDADEDSQPSGKTDDDESNAD